MAVSFSAKVKEEICREDVPARHCRIAQISAAAAFGGRIQQARDGRKFLELRTENAAVARKYFTLLKKTFNISDDVEIRQAPGQNRSRTYLLQIRDGKELEDLLSACRLQTGQDGTLMPADDLAIQQDCCRRAFIRGAFLAAGSVSNPVRSYHYEIVSQSAQKAEFLGRIMEHFGIAARTVLRKGHFVLYVKDSSQVVDLLNIMGAHSALMDMENVRIMKDLRNRVNRSFNCEVANINKTAAAAVKQITDIEYIRQCGAFQNMPENLQETASLRRQYPEATLEQLGSMLDKPIGKSGVNHRLKKISEFAQELRSQRETQ